MIKLHKGELWRPDSLKEAEEISVRISDGIGWVTFKDSMDLIYRPGQVLEINQQEPLIEALTDELNLEIEFKKKARQFFGKR